MSKKILIKINGRPNLIGLFHSYLSRKASEKPIRQPMTGIWGDDDYADYYDEIAARWGFDDEDYDILYPSMMQIQINQFGFTQHFVRSKIG